MLLVDACYHVVLALSEVRSPTPRLAAAPLAVWSLQRRVLFLRVGAPGEAKLVSVVHMRTRRRAGPLRAWEELVAALQDALQLLRSQHVPRILVKCVFKQLLAFVDAQLFNQVSASAASRPFCSPLWTPSSSTR